MGSLSQGSSRHYSHVVAMGAIVSRINSRKRMSAAADRTRRRGVRVAIRYGNASMGHEIPVSPSIRAMGVGTTLLHW